MFKETMPMNAIRKSLKTLRYELVEYYGRARQVGGYVHDTSMCQWIPPTVVFGDTATWVCGAGEVSGSLVYACDATDEVASLWIPVMLPSNSVDQKGAYLRSVQVDFEIKTAALDAMSATVVKMTRGADGADVTVSSLAFTYDTGHDAAAERIDIDEHKMTLTLDTPEWLDDDEYIYVKVAFDKAATSIVQFLGAFAYFTLRL
jgi:hypothetical protein